MFWLSACLCVAFTSCPGDTALEFLTKTNSCSMLYNITVWYIMFWIWTTFFTLTLNDTEWPLFNTASSSQKIKFTTTEWISLILVCLILLFFYFSFDMSDSMRCVWIVVPRSMAWNPLVMAILQHAACPCTALCAPPLLALWNGFLCPYNS